MQLAAMHSATTCVVTVVYCLLGSYRHVELNLFVGSLLVMPAAAW